jgi:hypothetical protein
MGMYRHTLQVAVGLTLFALAVVVSPASAAKPECKAINQTTNVAYSSNAYADPLGRAIADAGSGNTIKVMGTCYGNFVITKDLTLIGRRSKGHEDVINGGGSGDVLYGQGDLTVIDLTITGGDTGVRLDGGSLLLKRVKVTGNAGPGVGYGYVADKTIDDSVVSDNHGGGIVGGFFGSITVKNSTVRGNTTAGSGGGILGVRSMVTVSNSVIADNAAAVDGGGISTDYYDLTISGSLIEGNTAEGVGGGIAARGYSVGVELTASTIRDNTAINGGGIFYDGFWGLSVTGSVVTHNTATAAGGAAYLADNEHSLVSSFTSSTVSDNRADSGGGIFNSGGAVTLTNSVVTENSAGFSSGGIENNNFCDEVGTLTLVNSTVSNNDADFKWGGIANFGMATITDSTVSGNTAARGGGGITNWDTLVLIDSLVAGNLGDMGGGILNVGNAALTDTTVTGNTASITGGGIFNAEGFGTLALYGTSTVSGNAPNDIVTGPF